ncbi:MAG: phosphoglucosamine mutase, partial [Chloroflexota bacterium]
MTRLFGTDGVRGTVGEWPLVPEFALTLGKAAGAVLAADSGQPTVIVGRDTRQSGPMLQSALVAGLLASGADVLELGVITTPGVSWLTHKLGASAGVVISASHNPVEQNGIKFFGPEGMKLPEAVEHEIERPQLVEASRRHHRPDAGEVTQDDRRSRGHRLHRHLAFGEHDVVPPHQPFRFGDDPAHPGASDIELEPGLDPIRPDDG